MNYSKTRRRHRSIAYIDHWWYVYAFVASSDMSHWQTGVCTTAECLDLFPRSSCGHLVYHCSHKLRQRAKRNHCAQFCHLHKVPYVNSIRFRHEQHQGLEPMLISTDWKMPKTFSATSIRQLLIAWHVFDNELTWYQ